MTASSCDVCRNERPVVLVADREKRERALCGACWVRVEKHMPITVLGFAGPIGLRETK